MPTRILDNNEWKLESLAISHKIFINKCTNPTSASNVAVVIDVVYDDKSTQQFTDNVDLSPKTITDPDGSQRTVGEADHSTAVGRKAVNKARTTVTITW